MCALTPNFLVAPSSETIVALCHLHPLAEIDLPPFGDDFQPEMDLVLDRKAFIYALTCFPHLSFNNALGMVYKLFVGLFCL
jgi:hypothetical protein